MKVISNLSGNTMFISPQELETLMSLKWCTFMQNKKPSFFELIHIVINKYISL